MPGRKTYRFRVAAFVTILVVTAAAAGAGLVFALRAHAATAHVDRSEFAGEWTPTARSSAGRMRQIASFVRARYRMPGSTDRLADVTFRQPRLVGQPVKAFVIVHVATGQQVQFDPRQAAVFSECGSAADCSIPGASTLVGELAQREALETALRSFRADDSVQLVLVQMPVSLPQLGRIVVYFVRADLSRALERPLRATLPLNPPPTSDYTNPLEKKALATLVVNFAFNQQTREMDHQHAFVLLPASEMQPASQATGA